MIGITYFRLHTENNGNIDMEYLAHTLDLSHKLWQAALEVEHPRRSLLGVSVFLWMSAKHMEGEKVSMKTLSAQMGGPISVLRRLVRELEAEGWVNSYADEDDNRVRIVKPTLKFESIAEKLARECHARISEHPVLNQLKMRI